MNSSVYTNLDEISINLGSLNEDYEIDIFELVDDEKKDIYIKSPVVFYREDNLYELSMSSEDFYNQLKFFEEKIIQLVNNSDILPFNENFLRNLYSSVLETPKKIKHCPYIRFSNYKNSIVCDSKNNPIKDEFKFSDGLPVELIFKVEKIKFEKTKWEIIFGIEIIKPIEQHSEQVSEYMFRDSEEYTSIVLDTECL